KSDRGLSIMQSLVPKLNELVEASAKLDGIEHRYLRNGEWNMTGEGILGEILTALAQNAGYFARCDFDRAVSLSSQFERTEIRITAQFSLARGVLRGPSKAMPLRDHGPQVMPIDRLTKPRAEAEDCTAVAEMFKSLKVFPGTLQVPYPSREDWRKRITENPESAYYLVAVIDERVVGMVSIDTFPNRPRRKHAGAIGICVHEEWQGKGVGAALMRAILDLADNWLNLTRLELEVF